MVGPCLTWPYCIVRMLHFWLDPSCMLHPCIEAASAVSVAPWPQCLSASMVADPVFFVASMFAEVCTERCFARPMSLSEEGILFFVVNRHAPFPPREMKTQRIITIMAQ